MDYRDNPQHRVPHHIKWTSFAPPWWTNFAPPLTDPGIRRARGKRSLRQTGSDGSANENAGRGRGSECSRAAGVRRCRRAATRKRRNSGTAQGREPNFLGRLPSLDRRVARVSPLVVGACARRCCSGLLPARRIGRVAVRDCSPARSERRLEPSHLGQLRPCHRRLRYGSQADGPRGEVFVRRSQTLICIGFMPMKRGAHSSRRGAGAEVINLADGVCPPKGEAFIGIDPDSI